MSIQALIYQITQAGIGALFNAEDSGLQAQFSHIAFGTGIDNSGYTPQFAQTALHSEFLRNAIGSGERIANNEILVQAQMEGAGEGRINEIGFFLDDGTLFAIWSDPAGGIGEKKAGVPYVFAQTVVIDQVNLDNLEFIAGGPTVNIILAGPIAQMSAEIIRLQRRAVESENQRLIPLIQSTWR